MQRTHAIAIGQERGTVRHQHLDHLDVRFTRRKPERGALQSIECVDSRTAIRITSYNVCYTKLLRDGRGLDAIVRATSIASGSSLAPAEREELALLAQTVAYESNVAVERFAPFALEEVDLDVV